MMKDRSYGRISGPLRDPFLERYPWIIILACALVLAGSFALTAACAHNSGETPGRDTWTKVFDDTDRHLDDLDRCVGSEWCELDPLVRKFARHHGIGKRDYAAIAAKLRETRPR